MPDFKFVPDSVRAMELNAERITDKVKEVSTQCSHERDGIQFWIFIVI